MMQRRRAPPARERLRCSLESSTRHAATESPTSRVRSSVVVPDLDDSHPNDNDSHRLPAGGSRWLSWDTGSPILAGGRRAATRTGLKARADCSFCRVNGGVCCRDVIVAIDGVLSCASSESRPNVRTSWAAHREPDGASSDAGNRRGVLRQQMLRCRPTTTARRGRSC